MKYRIVQKGYQGYREFKHINYLRDYLSKTIRKNGSLSDITIIDTTQRKRETESDIKDEEKRVEKEALSHVKSYLKNTEESMRVMGKSIEKLKKILRL